MDQSDMDYAPNALRKFAQYTEQLVAQGDEGMPVLMIFPDGSCRIEDAMNGRVYLDRFGCRGLRHLIEKLNNYGV